MKMWNMLDLECPVKDVCKYRPEDGLILSDLPNLVSLLTTSAEILTEDNPIWTEIKVFRNVQAKYKRILHCDKCLLLLQRVGGCLRKMVLLNLSKSYLDLAEHLLSGLKNALLPSRQQLEYVLIRTQSAAKLICEALHYSREAFYYLIQRLRVGHLVLNLVMATSVTARVNIVFKGILVQIFDLYRKLYQWCDKLKRGTFEWPQTLDLPEDLELWLKPEETELLKPKHLPQDQIDFLTSFFENKASENPESDSESVIVVSDDNDSVIECTYENDMETSNDLGEVISRNENQHRTTESPPYQSEIKLTKSQKLLLDKISKAQTLKKLRIIWSNLNIGSSNLLPKILTPASIREIDNMFAEFKRRIIHIKTSKLSMAKREKDMKIIIKAAASKFAEQLGLVDQEASNDNDFNKSTDNLKPVKTFKELKKLYLSLYEMLQSDQQYDRCHKLKKVFRSRKADIMLLIENNEKAIARKLIFCTSKVFLTRYQI